MLGPNKLCDAADWFDPELHAIIAGELRELPRFHRKQWEFAAIFRALRRHGVLAPGRRGLSMGGGRERLLYAVASHVDELIVTDLYDTSTSWECARTESPQDFVRAGKPFAVDDARFTALRMDMRQLEFADASFDFCYSSCAFEHIGERADFECHLRETFRVLKPGGCYVMTTELHYGPETIPHPNNYVFSVAHLESLLRASGFDWHEHGVGTLVPHRANRPLPGTVASALEANHDGDLGLWRDEIPHLQLLRGRHPHTSALVVLHKDGRTAPSALRFHGLDESLAFLEEGIRELGKRMCREGLRLDAFAYLPGRSSAFCVASGKRRDGDDRTIFHTEYHWLGSGEREFYIRLDPAGSASTRSELELRVHSFKTLGQVEVECPLARRIEMLDRPVEERVRVNLRDDSCYAVLAHAVSGPCLVRGADVRLMPAVG